MRSTVYSFLYVAVGFVFGGWIVAGIAANVSVGIGSAILTLSVVAFSGGFGGLLFAMRQSTRGSQLFTPQFSFDEESRWLDIGCLSDAFYGVAGAFVIFLVTPGMSEAVPNVAMISASARIETVDLLEVIAVAVVGGYAGRALMDKASDSIAKVEQSVDDLKTEVSSRIEEQEAKSQNREGVMAGVFQQLDLDEAPVSEEVLNELIGNASYEAKRSAYFTAKRAYFGKPADYAERAIPVLRALISADPSELYCTTRAVLARCYGTLADWEQALSWIDKAIKIRDERGISGLNRYEEFRAVCRISFCNEFKSGLQSTQDLVDEVLSDLRTAFPDDEEFSTCTNQVIIDWLKINREPVGVDE